MVKLFPMWQPTSMWRETGQFLCSSLVVLWYCPIAEITQITSATLVTRLCPNDIVSINILASYHECCFFVTYTLMTPFKQWSVLSRLIVAPRKCDVLKTNICPKSEASRANMLVLRTSNFLLSLLFTTKFSSALVQKSYWIIFNLFWMKVKREIWKRKQTKTHLVRFQLFIFYKPACLQENFHGRALSIQVFSADGDYGLIVALRGWALSRHVINLNQ